LANRLLPAIDEIQKAKIQSDLAVLTKRLAQVNESLGRKIASRNEYEKTIQETEAAYQKVSRLIKWMRQPWMSMACDCAPGKADKTLLDIFGIQKFP
jgi:chromosome segregation ATPase